MGLVWRRVLYLDWTIGVSAGFVQFAIISGLGWMIDVGTTVGLVQIGVSPFWASVVGAGVAVTFVYVVSRLMVFTVRQLGGPSDYAIYVIWQVCAIAVASVCVALIGVTVAPLAASWRTEAMPDALALATGFGKVVVTPITLGANFLFMRWLTNRFQRPTLNGQN